jgi:SAM-dependent methyltransferase
MMRMNAVAPSPTASPGSGQLTSIVLAVAGRLALAGLLADGARTVSDLALATSTHGPSLHRLLRALACLRVTDETEPGVFTLAPPDPHDPAVAGPASPGPVPLFTEGNLLHSVQTGQPALGGLFRQPVFESIAASPAASAALAAFTGRATERAAPALVAAADFARFGTVIDVGGGTGTLIRHILRASPGTRGVVYDTAASAPAATQVLGSAPEAAGRWEVRAGDFFRDVPPGGDAYVVKSVLHDWDDEKAARILRNCRAVMGPAARLLIFEPVLPRHAAWSAAHLPAVLSDLICLVMTNGGRERTEAEYRALCASAGLAAVSVSPVTGSAHFSLVEATAGAGG